MTPSSMPSISQCWADTLFRISGPPAYLVGMWRSESWEPACTRSSMLSLPIQVQVISSERDLHMWLWKNPRPNSIDHFLSLVNWQQSKVRFPFHQNFKTCVEKPDVVRCNSLSPRLCAEPYLTLEVKVMQYSPPTYQQKHSAQLLGFRAAVNDTLAASVHHAMIFQDHWARSGALSA